MKFLNRYLILTLALSAASVFRIHFVGYLQFSDIIAIGVFPFCFFAVEKYKEANRVIFYLILYCIGLILSDIWNGSPWGNVARGQAALFVLICSIYAFIFIFNYKIDYIKYFFIGMLLASLYSYYFGGEDDLYAYFLKRMTVDHDKYYMLKYGTFLIPVINIIACLTKPKNYVKYSIFLLGCSLLFIFINGRYFAAVYGMAGIVLFLSSENLFGFIRQHIVVLISGLIILGYALYCGYVYAALEQEWFQGRSYTQLASCENPYNPLDYLSVGRAEVLIGLKAAIDNPIIGYGSWCPDVDGKYSEMYYEMKGISSKKQSIKNHSAVVGAWCWAGILGLIGWLAIAVFIFKKCIFLIDKKCHLLPIVIIIMFDSMWNLFFSPLTQARSYLPAYVAFLTVLAWQTSNKEEVDTEIKAVDQN